MTFRVTEVEFDPPLPQPQADAFRDVRMGRAARVLLQFESRFWKRRRQPSLFASDLAFHPGFDPLARAWLARPSGRVLFAGEHTSERWQGYMNGAIESGQRAASEVMAANNQ